MSSNNSLSVSDWPCTLKILSSNVDEAVYHRSHVEKDQE
ncbi:hypothetical protein SNOG_03686 [Parastagonospora nodorum SN15]|uniref:Uncharacterized protein n=1 Tax=Phaeosphaeria nodorum (strain SN15 / ATCC MYA-4574 / FGSC 10173) TaxID=321614 RepID=Q0UX28_PHANO|nr:hypothetical protein SNOG_03686 [Parastagonospora nodorum SN15]EAT88891.1 hypothetical protein SNOG_03686 [Parastagonospora nodorum SN15]